MKQELSDLFDKTKEYVNVRTDILKLTVAEKASKAAAAIVVGGILLVCSLFVLLFFSFFAALYISESMGNSYCGFLFVGLFYLLVGLFVFLIKTNMIEKPIINKLVKILCKPNTVENENLH
ncbi:MAG TPA: phage holin family protein [Sphingobacteriaceae bacterium]|nr:phage holin family protein [Sphingobacteriaceae bacterium]